MALETTVSGPFSSLSNGRTTLAFAVAMAHAPQLIHSNRNWLLRHRHENNTPASEHRMKGGLRSHNASAALLFVLALD